MKQNRYIMLALALFVSISLIISLLELYLTNIFSYENLYTANSTNPKLKRCQQFSIVVKNVTVTRVFL